MNTSAGATNSAICVDDPKRTAPPAAPPFQVVPGTVQVVSATEIVVQLDTLSALPGYTYYVAVWNPGGPQKSNTCATLPGALPGFTVSP